MQVGDVGHHREVGDQREGRECALDDFHHDQRPHQRGRAVRRKEVDQAEQYRQDLEGDGARRAEQQREPLAGAEQDGTERDDAGEESHQRRKLDDHHLFAAEGPEVLQEIEAQRPVHPGRDEQRRRSGGEPHERLVARALADVADELRQEPPPAGRCGVHVPDLRPRSRGRHQDRHRHRRAERDREGRVVLRQEPAAARVGEEPADADDDRERRAQVGEELAQQDEPGALLRVLRDLRAQGQVRDVVERQGEPGEHGEGGQPEEQADLTESRRRREQADEGQPHRQRRREHEGMAPPQLRPAMIGPGSDQRVREPVDQQGDEQRRAGQRARQTQHLVVVEQHEQGGRVALHALGGLADAVRDPGEEGYPPILGDGAHAPARPDPGATSPTRSASPCTSPASAWGRRSYR